MTKEEAIWQLFSLDEEEDKYLRLLVKLRLINRATTWVRVTIVTAPFQSEHKVVKRYQYRITPQGELALKVLNFLTRLGWIEGAQA